MKARALLLLAGLAAAGCATSGAFEAARKAEDRHDFDRAVLEYARAVKENPEEPRYQKALAHARLRASYAHAQSARSLLARGMVKDATDEFRLAYDLDPSDSSLREELARAEAQRAGVPQPSMEDAKRRARERALPGLDLAAAGREPLGLSFPSASLREIYQALGKAAGVNFVFDPQYQDQVISIDLRDVEFEQALNALAAAGRTFYRVVDRNVVTVVPDTPTKRREYEQQFVKTFFLSNADVKETIDLLRVVLGARRVAAVAGANAVTISDDPDKVAAAERLISVIDKKRSEVEVEVEILEVNRGRLDDYGIEISSGPSGTGVVGVIAPDPTKTFHPGDNPYSKDNLVISNLPGVIYRLLHTDSATRLLANPRLRSSEGQTAQARFGEQVPVPVTVFTPISQGGLSQQPVTSYEYKNVGVNIDITPRVHQDGEISLALKLDISSVGQPGFQGIPTFNSRQLTSVIRLRDGETNILAGLISETERTSLTGIPGLARLPVLGRLFGRNTVEAQQTDIVMTLTPHVLRRARLTEEDLKSFPAGSEGGPVLFELPGLGGAVSPGAAAAPPVSPRAPASPPPAEPRVEPIRPPVQPPQPQPSPVG